MVAGESAVAEVEGAAAASEVTLLVGGTGYADIYLYDGLSPESNLGRLL